MRYLFLLLGLLWIGAAFGSNVAEASPVAVDVVAVRFNQPRLPGQSYPWMESELTLRPVGNAKVSPENISVTLWLSYKQPTGKVVYKGSVKLYSLQDQAKVRFYLPPDVLRARRLPQSPTAYYLEISSSAGAEAFDSRHASPGLLSLAARAELKSAPAEPLLSQPQTPFYSSSETFRDMPAYVVP